MKIKFCFFDLKKLKPCVYYGIFHLYLFSLTIYKKHIMIKEQQWSEIHPTVFSVVHCVTAVFKMRDRLKFVSLFVAVMGKGRILR